MLARLSQVEAAPESFSMDMENLRLILPASSSWGRIALSCIPPAGRNLLASIHHDIESVAHLLAALEPEMDLSSESEATPLATDSLNADASIRIPIPRIVVTPCPDAPRETSCWVPMQDSAFRTRLTVPLHPSLNRSFPPMAASPRRVPVKAWIWTNGHWQATTRGLEPRPRKLQCRKKKKSRQKAGL